MITCPSCGKRNQDHYKFCLACGAELPRSAAEDPSTRAFPAFEDSEIMDEPTSLGTGDAAFEDGENTAQPSPVTTDGRGSTRKVSCPDCGHVNPTTNRFCSACGHKVDVPSPSVEPHGGTGVALVALSPEGSEVGTFTLNETTTLIGRETGGIFKGDRFLSPQHARFTVNGGGVTVQDANSLNGVFRKLTPEQEYPLEPGQMFRIGQELLLFESLESEDAGDDGADPMGSPADEFVGRVSLVVGRATPGPTYPVPRAGLNLGRERGHVLFSEDGYVSGLHCRLTVDDDGQMHITDLGSSNGTFLRILEAEHLDDGDIVLMGQQLFRVSVR